MSVMKIYGISKEYDCPCCGRRFYAPYQSKGGGRTKWQYKVRIANKYYYLCSYSCLNEFKKEVMCR